MTFKTAILKQAAERILMWPFVFAGRVAGKLFRAPSSARIFLFFPSADIGGSIRVNADICECLSDQELLIIFSKKPKNNQFRHLFDLPNAKVIDLAPYIDNKLFHFVNFFFRGVLASWINRVPEPVVFGGECIFFYKVIPHVKRTANRVELCHMNTWFNFSQAYIPFMDHRIFSTPKIRRDAEQQYRTNHVPPEFLDRLLFADNKINIPPYTKTSNDILQVLYVGRGAPQKRVHLISAIAAEMHQAGSPVHFSFVGDVEKIIPAEQQAYCTLYGHVKDEKELNNIYLRSDVLILTSEYEGLPLVVMDMMARGKTVLSTAVDGIPDYVQHLDNGLLIRSTDEKAIIREAVDLLSLLLKNPSLKEEIGARAYRYALDHFSGEHFCGFYRSVLLGKQAG